MKTIISVKIRTTFSGIASKFFMRIMVSKWSALQFRPDYLEQAMTGLSWRYKKKANRVNLNNPFISIKECVQVVGFKKILYCFLKHLFDTI